MALPLALIPAATGVVGGILSYNRSGKKTSQERNAEAMGQQAQDYINLSMNPNDPRYKEMVANESTGIQQNFLSSLRDLIEANRRQKTLGRQQIFDPERQDESMFSAITRGKQEADQQANSNVLDRLNQAISNLRGQQQTSYQLSGLERDRRDAKTQAILGGLSAGGKAGSSLSKLYGV